MSDVPVIAERAPLIRLVGVSRVYRMGLHDVHALRDVSLEIGHGEFVAIVGPSGSGKSTLMALLGCLDTPTAGSYVLEGREVRGLGDEELSRVRCTEIGFVFQQFHLLPELDVMENIALGLAYAGEPPVPRRARAVELAARVGVDERAAHRPSELSGGQAQRVAIARALAAGPALLLADEPTGNLDTRTGAEIIGVLRDLHAQGRTVVLVTHDRGVAEQADRVITLVDGEIRSDVRTRETGSGPVPATREGGIAPPPRRRIGRLRARDLLRMAWREGLLAHKLRSLLTMLGIIFGIASVIIMTAITEGGKQEQLDQLRQIGLRNIFVRDAELQGAALLRERRIHPPGVSLGDLDYLRRYLPGLAASSASRAIPAELRHGDRVAGNTRVLGVDGAFESVFNYHVARGGGRFIDAHDGQTFARVCVLGARLAERLGLGPDDLGAVLLVGDQPFTLVGIMEAKQFSESRISDVSIADRSVEAYIPLATLRAFFRKDPKESELDEIGLSMADEAALVETSALVEHMIGRLHHDAADFHVSVPLEKLRQARQTTETFNTIIIVISGISLLVGGIGIMNIMLANVTERTREIGIRRAVGASRRGILAQFLAEALLIACSGGALGIVSGLVGGMVVEWLVGVRVVFSAGLMAAAVLVSMAVGTVFGLYPAWKAAVMDPVEALRG